MTKLEFEKAMETVIGGWPSTRFNEFALPVWFEKFKQFSAGDFLRAVDVAIEKVPHASIKAILDELRHGQAEQRHQQTFHTVEKEELTDEEKVAEKAKRLAIVEKCRPKLQELLKAPLPRKDVEDGEEILAGNEDQRFVTREEKQSIDELWCEEYPQRESRV